MRTMQTKQVVTALSALAQESRLGIFRLLVQVGPHGMAASKISQELAIPPSSLSFHLKELTQAGLLTSRHESRFIFYSANFEIMNGVLAYLMENCCGGNPCHTVPTCAMPTIDTEPCHPTNSDPIDTQY